MLLTPPRRALPTTLLVDSQCALDIANNSKIGDRSKHIEVQPSSFVSTSRRTSSNLSTSLPTAKWPIP